MRQICDRQAHSPKLLSSSEDDAVLLCEATVPLCSLVLRLSDSSVGARVRQ